MLPNMWSGDTLTFSQSYFLKKLGATVIAMFQSCKMKEKGEGGEGDRESIFPW